MTADALLADALRPGVVDVVVRLTAATAFAAVMGLQREFDGHAAGVRTHALLAGGAALFGAMSVGAFGGVATGDATNVRVDVTRIASYVAAGIGFLGGGVIVKKDGRAHGLTTAASLWSAAAIGLAAGLGFWVGAVTATVLSLALLLLEKPVAWFVERSGRSEERVVRVGRSDGVVDGATVRQEFGISVEGATTVVLVGEFNGWKPVPMKRDGASYRTTVDVQPGRSYRYKFLIDGAQWVNDPSAGEYAPNEFGGDDSVVRVQEEPGGYAGEPRATGVVATDDELPT